MPAFPKIQAPHRHVIHYLDDRHVALPEVVGGKADVVPADEADRAAVQGALSWWGSIVWGVSVIKQSIGVGTVSCGHPKATHL